MTFSFKNLKLIILFFILGCEGLDNKKIYINDYLNPADGIIIYSEIETDISLKSSKTLMKHLLEAIDHCKKFEKKAKFLKSGNQEVFQNGTKIKKRFEKYSCI